MRYHFTPIRMAIVKEIRKHQVLLARMKRSWNAWALLLGR